MAYDAAYVSGPYHFGGKGSAQMWIYDDTAEVATVVGAGYIATGADLGMRLGDIVIYRKFDSLTTLANSSMSLHNVSSISGDAVTLTAAYGSSSGLTVPVTSSTGTPGATDDISPSGYLLGSIWVETDQDQAYVNVDNTNSAAIWRPIVDQFVMTWDTFSIDTDGTTVTMRMVVPQPANLIKAFTVNGAVTTSAGSAILTLSRNTTAITNGAITIDGTTGVGVTDSCTPTALNTFAAGDILTGVLSGTQTANSTTVNFCALFERLPS